MLYPHDERIVQRELSIPGMRALLDNDGAATVFQAAFPRLDVRSATCQYLRYKPDTNCIASFTLETKLEKILAHAIAYRVDAIDKVAKALQESSQTPSLRAVMADQSLVISLFPLDDHLQSLRLIASRPEQALLIKRLVPHNEDLHSAPLTTLRYKPRRRYVGRIDVEDTPRAILKIHSLPEFQRARRAAKSLHCVSGITPATVLGHSDRHRAILYKWVPGASLSEHIQDSPNDLLEIMEDLGWLLREVHGHPNIKLPTIYAQETLSSLIAIPRELTAVSPDLADHVQDAVHQAACLYEQLDRPLASLHGDLSLDQILVGDGVSVIDFDNAALGHAEQDLGNLLAHCEKSVLEGRFPAGLEGDMFDTLVNEYLHRDGQADWHAIHLYAAMALLRMTQEPFRGRLANWHLLSTEIVRRAEQQLKLAVHASRSSRWYHRAGMPTTATAVAAFREDESLCNSHPAVDIGQARTLLLPLLQDALQDESLQLSTLRLRRHKFGKRCLVEYTCQGRDRDCQFHIIGKAHAKRRHHQNHQIQHKLWENGFGHQAADQIMVPKPLGVIDQWQMWFQERVSGEDGWTALAGDQGESFAAQLLYAIEKLQQSELLTDRQHTVVEEIQVLRGCLPKVALQVPELRLRIARLLSKCQDLAHALPTMALVPTHRDFYPDQVSVSAGGLYLLDFDLFCLSHPCLDLGNFCGHLIERGIRSASFIETNARCHTQFRRRYLQEDRQCEWKSVEAFATLTLARHVYLSTLFPNRAQFMPAILQECERRLDVQLVDSYWVDCRWLSHPWERGAIVGI